MSTVRSAVAAFSSSATVAGKLVKASAVETGTSTVGAKASGGAPGEPELATLRVQRHPSVASAPEGRIHHDHP